LANFLLIQSDIGNAKAHRGEDLAPLITYRNRQHLPSTPYFLIFLKKENGGFDHHFKTAV